MDETREAVSAASAPTRFAVMMLGGTQYKVATDDLIAVEKMELHVGQSFVNESVLMVGEAEATVIGSPLIAGASVEGVVEEQALADKVIIFKKKKRKGYRHSSDTCCFPYVAHLTCHTPHVTPHMSHPTCQIPT
jgi:large subunit ribosomal protein L21|tara:strand:+ start:1523 stop:1924 length:402 start_codon:yes stop_codon:yes gene_type:complete